jgi:hypothetical protein
VREKPADALSEDPFVSWVTVPIHSIRINLFATMMILTELEPGDPIDWESIVAGDLTSVYRLHVEYGEST